MRLYLSLGSNLGERKDCLRQAVEKLKALLLDFEVSKLSPIYESPALLTQDAPSEWNLPYLNLVAELKYKKKSKSSSAFFSEEEKKSLAFSLLNQIQKIEKDMGRKDRKRGAPRLIDIDILLWEGLRMSSENLILPHKGLNRRPFFLLPLKDLLPNFDLKENFFFVSSSPDHQNFEGKTTALKEVRQKNFSSPLWMAILNVTPDSFSDGGKRTSKDLESFAKEIQGLEEAGVHILDIGGESTRPGATPLDPKEEWKRVFPFLKFLKERYQNQSLKPLISLDTRHAETAEKALEWNVDWINDVSGLRDPRMLSLLKNSSFQYVLTHSLSVPVKPSEHLSLSEDPVLFLKKWCKDKISLFVKEGLDLKRFLFDPGIGFGKTSLQSLEILKRIKEFHDLPFRLLIGASRKSFMNSFASKKMAERDLESLGLSLWLTNQSVDVLRVHDVLSHTKAFRGWSHVNQKGSL